MNSYALLAYSLTPYLLGSTLTAKRIQDQNGVIQVEKFNRVIRRGQEDLFLNSEQVEASPLFAAALAGEERDKHPEFTDIILLDALISDFNVELLRQGWIIALVIADPDAKASPGGTNPGLVISRGNLEEMKKQHPGLIPGV